MSTICFYAQFTKTLVGVNSLTVTWDIEKITRSDGTRAALVTGGANGITVGRRGLYGYVLTSADLTLYDYVATAITAGDVDQQEVAAMWTYWNELGGTVANQTTILARIGAFTGTGVNTILGFLKAIASKAATLPTDIGGTFNPATDSNEAIADAMPPAPPATVTVSDITQAALAKFANTDTLEVAAVAGSVAELSQCNAAGFPAGSIEYTLTIESPGGIPIAGASVWISTDVGMTNIIWRGVTDTFGTARDVNNQKPWLDAGLYQFWVQDDNWTDSNPTPMVVS